jgi:diphthamide synthase (EF-2-diphthine--ammonia ligase)
MANGTGLRPKALIAWSSGKDSAWALHLARRAGDYEIVGALTTVTDTFSRISIHGVREELLLAQLKAAALPATVVRIPYPCANEVYEERMAEAMRVAIASGVTHVIFGDMFLQDIRDARQTKLAPNGITP